MSWIDPITDRTQVDADRLIELNCIGWHGMTEEERIEWENSKGALNESDFNRVEHNLKYLSDLLNLGFTTYDDNIPYIIGATYVANLKANLGVLKNCIYAKLTTPNVPNEPLKGLAWNDVEQIILDCYEKFGDNFSYQSIDELHAGEYVGLVL